MHQKTVKFKDIPKRVQELLKRVFNRNFPSSYEFDLDWLHALPKWSCATDDERLAYARWRYPKGVKFIDFETNGTLTSAGESFSLAWFYDFKNNRWAEIIEEPFNLTDTGDFRSEPEFKAGDEVVLDGSDAKTVFTIIHIFDGEAWIKNESMMFGKLVMLHRLRKPDPDKHLREIAKELLIKWGLSQSYRYADPDVLSCVIEALKKGKEL